MRIHSVSNSHQKVKTKTARVALCGQPKLTQHADKRARSIIPYGCNPLAFVFRHEKRIQSPAKATQNITGRQGKHQPPISGSLSSLKNQEQEGEQQDQQKANQPQETRELTKEEAARLSL